jgi:MinD-like ATPase involved in chromosome partitioning or flagellar assembly
MATNIVALSPDPIAAERIRSWGGVALPYDASVEDLVAACSRAPAPRQELAAPVSPEGKLIAVWGPKGAPGRTSISFELASELAASEPRTLLVDADTYGGDLLQLSGVVDELGSIVWATRLAAKGELGPAVLTTELRRTTDMGPVLLPGIPRSDLWPEISEFGWTQMLDVALSTFRFVVTDIGFALEPSDSPYPEQGEGRNGTARSTLRRADRVVAVVRADPVGVKTFLWAYEQLRELLDPETVSIVVNRVRAGEAQDVSDLLKRYLRKKQVAMIPDEPEAFSEAVARGIPVRSLRAGSRVAAGIEELAASIGGRVRTRGFLARLGGRT